MNAQPPISQEGPDPARRRLVYAGVAGLAALAGGGLAWWNSRLGLAPGSADSLWPLAFETPTGQVLQMQALRGRPLLLNFWATWCPPCVDELPLLDRFYRENVANRWQVVGLAIDQPSAVRTFLKQTPISFPVGMAGLEGTELGRSLGNLSGGLPFTVVMDANGSLRHRKMGRVTEAELHQWVDQA